MTDLNVINLIGRLTRDAETKPAGNSTKIRLSVANNYSKKTGETWEDKTNFFDVECWNLSEKFTSCLLKGAQVVISGSLRQDTWDDKDGNRKTRIYILSNSLQLVGRPQNAAPQMTTGEAIQAVKAAQERQTQAQTPSAPTAESYPDDIPW